MGRRRVERNAIEDTPARRVRKPCGLVARPECAHVRPASGNTAQPQGVVGGVTLDGVGTAGSRQDNRRVGAHLTTDAAGAVTSPGRTARPVARDRRVVGEAAAHLALRSPGIALLVALALVLGEAVAAAR